jgi:hypothetical protein
MLVSKKDFSFVEMTKVKKGEAEINTELCVNSLSHFLCGEALGASLIITLRWLVRTPGHG